MHVEWWYWIVAGFCLIGLELILPSFTIIWFGMAALAVGVLTGLLAGIPLFGQIVLWLCASFFLTAMWFKYLKPKNSRIANVALNEEVVGETGVITRGTKNSNRHGVVKLRISTSGAREWGCHCKEMLHVGDRVRVVEREGQLLKVEII